MPAENAQYISELVKTKPTGGESISEGDDHLRAIKTAVHQSFPKISSEVTATPSDLNAVNGLITDVAGLKGNVGDIDNNSHGNVASCYYDVNFLDAGNPNKGIVYGHNIFAVVQDPDFASGTRVIFETPLDNYEDSSSAHYAFNITPITLNGNPIVISVADPSKQWVSFISYEWDGSTFNIVPPPRQSFSLTVIDMDKSQ